VSGAPGSASVRESSTGELVDEPVDEHRHGRPAGPLRPFVAGYAGYRQAGAQITAEPHDTDYGSRDFAARDPEGNRWSFGTYRGEPRKA